MLVATAWIPLHQQVARPLQFTSTSPSLVILRATKVNGKRSKSGFLKDFKIGDEIIEPYQILKVSRDASRQEIKTSYRRLCKKYHPDGARYRSIMPGSCDNLEDVRDEWERIKFSYEILSDKKMRARYEREYNLSHPGAAVGRAALGTVSWGVMELGKGLFKAGEFAISKIATDDENNSTPEIQKEEAQNEIYDFDTQ